MKDAPYAELLSRIIHINQLAQAGRWDEAAELASRLHPEKLPPAQAADLAAIKTTLGNIADLNERASALRQDLSLLLNAFGAPPA